jgi:hypothetical protein
VRRAQGPGQAFAGQADLGGGVANLPAIAGHHEVNRGADLFRDALRWANIGRRRLVQGGKSAFGGHWGRDLFHDRHHRRLPVHRNALNVTFYVSPNLIEWFWNQILRYTFKHFLGTNAHLLLDVCRRRSAMFGRKTKFQSERLMAHVYLGIMIAGVNTLIVLGAALAFVVI